MPRDQESLGSNPTSARCYKASMAVLRYAIRLMPYAASGSVELARIITTLDGFLQP